MLNRYIKIKFNGRYYPEYLHYVDESYIWTPDKIISENAKAVNLAKMAFLDHGEPLIPLDVLPEIMEQRAIYLSPSRDVIFLIYEGGNFMTLLPGMEIIEEVYSQYYPIREGAAIVCENDAFDKWSGRLDHVFLNMAKLGGTDNFHYMFNFRSRTEDEVIDAFKNTPAIIFQSSHIDVDWWELMLRCIIKSRTKAKIIGHRYNGNVGLRFDRCIELAEKLDIKIITY